MDTNIVSVAEITKMLRKALASAFPGTKFTVRRQVYDIFILWEDGPTQKQVSQVTARFGDNDRSPVIREYQGEPTYFEPHRLNLCRSYSDEVWGQAAAEVAKVFGLDDGYPKTQYDSRSFCLLLPGGGTFRQAVTNLLEMPKEEI